MLRPTLFLALVLAACQPAGPPAPSFTQADRDSIEARHTAWTTAANAGDKAALAALYTEDAALLPPNLPSITGRAGIRSAFDSFPAIGDAKFRTIDVAGSGDFAVVQGAYTMNVMLPGATAAVADTGKFIELWRKQADGSWLISWDIWNSDVALPAPAPAKK